MRRIALASLVLASATLGSSSPPPAETADAEIAACLAFLTSPALEGRGAAEPGGAIAAGFLAARLETLGWHPAGDLSASGRATFLQSVPAVAARYDASASFLEMARRDGSMKIRVRGAERSAVLPGKGAFDLGEFLYVPDRAESVEVTGTLTFAGFGITAAEHGRDDYAKLDVRGKVVLVFSGEPGELDPASPWNGARPTRHALTSTKQRLAGSLGAVALLVVPNPAGKAKTAADLAGGSTGDASSSWLGLSEGAPGIPVVDLDPETARLLLQGSRLDLKKASKKAEAGKSASREIRDRTLTVRLAMKERHDVALSNVVARLGDGNADGAIVIGAHWDGLGAAGGGGYEGADDNASGVAAALAAARELAASPPAGRTPIYLALFTGEEAGRLGSRYFVAHPLASPIRAAINLDMLGRNNLDRADYANVLQVIYSAQAPELRVIAKAANAGIDFDLRFYGGLRFQPVSDHYTFFEAGVPIVYPFSGYHADYHTPGDTKEKLVLSRIARSARYVAALARLLAERSDSIRIDATIQEAPPADPFERGY